MKSIHTLKTGLALVGLLFGLAGASVARADSYNISLDTSSLVGSSAGPFYLDLQSIYGSGLAPTITLSNFFVIGGGFVAGTELAVGNVAGDLGTQLVLSPSAGSFYNDFSQQFDSTVTGISFHVDFSANSALLTPTSFAVSLLDSTGVGIATTGIADTLVAFDINGSHTSYTTGVSTGATGGASATVPDAGGSAGLVLGALVVLGLARQRKSLPLAA
jgi:hypothetical protein